MQGAAKAWWQGIAVASFRGLTLDQISWDQFRHAFIFRYLPEEAIKAKKLEFQSLTQGKDTVTVYFNRFTELMVFASRLVLTEKDRVYRFVDGLIGPMRQRLFSLKLDNLGEAYAAACRDERAYNTRV